MLNNKKKSFRKHEDLTHRMDWPVCIYITSLSKEVGKGKPNFTGQPMFHYILANKSGLLLLVQPTQGFLLVQEAAHVSNTTCHCIEQKRGTIALRKEFSLVLRLFFEDETVDF